MLGKLIVLKADARVTIKNNEIVNDSCLRNTLPTLNFLTDRGAKVIIYTKQAHISPIAKRLQMLSSSEVNYISSSAGVLSLETAINTIQNGQVLMLQDDQKSNQETIKYLTKSAAAYVNDDFNSAYEPCILSENINDPCLLGAMMERELQTLQLWENRNIGAIISDDIITYNLIRNKLTTMCLSSSNIKDYESKIITPIDFYVENNKVVPVSQLVNQQVKDIGPQTSIKYFEALKSYDCIFWTSNICNEVIREGGTSKLIEYLKPRIKKGLTSIICSEEVANLLRPHDINFYCTYGIISASYLIGGKQLQSITKINEKPTYD